MTASMDKEFYRLVPYRFFCNEADADTCKLEKLTNLFPDMKEIIELELFKINNLSRTIDRLSCVYTVMTVLDVRDDTIHLFLGPYHLLLGPANFGALRFKNISAILLATTISHPTKRRHEAVLRRFRRCVRKLILVKSIIDQLRLASILIPYNQYELYKRGIYDLVLTGHSQNLHSILDNEDFIERINNIQSEEQSTLLASSFTKINALLHLLAPAQHQTVNNLSVGNTTQTKSNDTNSNTTNKNDTRHFIDSGTMCCPQHCHDLPLVKLPMTQPVCLQSTPTGPRSRLNSSHNLNKNSTGLSRQDTTSSLTGSTTSDIFGIDDIQSPTAIVSSSSLTITKDNIDKAKGMTPSHPNPLSSRRGSNEEDLFIDRISSLVTSYLLSHQPTTKGVLTSYLNEDHETNSKLNDKTISLSDNGTKITSNTSDVLNQLSSLGDPDDVNQLLQRIKTVIDNKLSRKTDANQMRPPQNLSHIRMKPKAPNCSQYAIASRPVSYHETSINESDVKHTTSSNNKHKLLLSSKKSQSFDEINSMLSSTQAEIDDDSVAF